MINSSITVIGAVAILMARPCQSAHAQQPREAARVAVGIGAVVRDASADGESRFGLAADVVLRSTPLQATWRARGALRAAYFPNRRDFEGRYCNPDGPCEYAAPAATVLSGSIGVEWSSPVSRVRVPISLATHYATTRQLPRDQRRGVGVTGGINAGVVLPLDITPRGGEVEIRYEWLARPVESTRYFVPIIARVYW